MSNDPLNPFVEKLVRDSETLATSAERAAFLRGAFQADDRLKDAFAAFCADIGPGAMRDSEVSERTLEAQEIPGIENLELIGEGGMGRVYRGIQKVPLRREVAVKILKATVGSEQILKRFELERQTLALLNHPSIAKVFDAGVTPAGDAYFVMELIKGETLIEFVNSRSLGLVERLTLFAAICRGVGHAHQKGVVHRDLKPSNILVAEEDGGFVPKIIDFGIAKAVESRLGDTVLTLESQLLGTPAYMSPEQADMARGDIDTRADIYSLGTILYQLVSGALPFDQEELMAEGYAGMLRIISERTPVLPSRRLHSLKRQPETQDTVASKILPNRLSADVDAIVMKSIEKVRDLRYPTAEALRSDLEAYLARRPVTARRAGWLYFVRKFVGRHQGVCLSALGAFFVLILGVFLLVSYAGDLADSNETLSQRLYIADMTSALEAREQTNLQRVSELVSRHQPEGAAGRVDRREFEWYFLQAELDRFNAVPAMSLGASVDEIALDIDEELLIAGGFGSDFVWADVNERSVLKTVPVCGEELTRNIAYSSDRSRLVACCNELVVFTTDGTVEKRHMGEGGEIWASFSPDDKWIGYGGWSGSIYLWNLESDSHERLEPAFAPSHWVQRVFFTENQRYIVASCHREIMVWEFASRKLVARWHPHKSPDGKLLLDIGAFVLSPDGQSVITAGATDRKVKVFETTTGRIRQDANGPLVRDAIPFMAPICLNSAGDQLFISGENNTIAVLDLGTGLLSDPVPGHSRALTGMALSRDDKWLITSGAEGAIKFWDTELLRQSKGFHTGFSEGSHIEFSPAGDELAVSRVTLDGQVALEIFDKDSRELRHRLESPEVIFQFRYHPGGSRLLEPGLLVSIVGHWSKALMQRKYGRLIRPHRSILMLSMKIFDLQRSGRSGGQFFWSIWRKVRKYGGGVVERTEQVACWLSVLSRAASRGASATW